MLRKYPQQILLRGAGEEDRVIASFEMIMQSIFNLWVECSEYFGGKSVETIVAAQVCDAREAK